MLARPPGSPQLGRFLPPQRPGRFKLDSPPVLPDAMDHTNRPGSVTERGFRVHADRLPHGSSNGEVDLGLSEGMRWKYRIICKEKEIAARHDKAAAASAKYNPKNFCFKPPGGAGSSRAQTTGSPGKRQEENGDEGGIARAAPGAADISLPPGGDELGYEGVVKGGEEGQEGESVVAHEPVAEESEPYFESAPGGGGVGGGGGGGVGRGSATGRSHRAVRRRSIQSEGLALPCVDNGGGGGGGGVGGGEGGEGSRVQTSTYFPEGTLGSPPPKDRLPDSEQFALYNHRRTIHGESLSLSLPPPKEVKKKKHAAPAAAPPVGKGKKGKKGGKGKKVVPIDPNRFQIMNHRTKPATGQDSGYSPSVHRLKQMVVLDSAREHFTSKNMVAPPMATLERALIRPDDRPFVECARNLPSRCGAEPASMMNNPFISWNFDGSEIPGSMYGKTSSPRNGPGGGTYAQGKEIVNVQGITTTSNRHTDGGYVRGYAPGPAYAGEYDASSRVHKGGLTYYPKNSKAPFPAKRMLTSTVYAGPSCDTAVTPSYAEGQWN